MKTKVCTLCGKEYPITDYYVIKADGIKRKSDYVYSYCKKCHYSKMTKATAKKWRKKYPKRWNEDVKQAQKAMFGRQREGVYMLVTNKGLYIGQTDKYEHRLNQHRNNDFKGNVKHKGAKILFHMLIVEENNRKRRKEIEKFWINLLRPALNKQDNPDWKRENKPGGKYIKK